MDFTISEEQSELLKKLDEFCEKNLSEAEIQKWIADGGVPDSFMLDYYLAGFASVGLPERMGGFPASVLTRALVLERLGKRAGATLPIQGLTNDMHIISDIANDDQVALVKGMIEKTGKPGFSFAVTEPQSGSNTFDVNTTAVEEEGGFVINGAKSFVSSGQYAPYVMLVAHDASLTFSSEEERKPLTFFLLPLDTEGIDAISVSKVGQHLIPTAEVVFSDVHVGKDAVMGERGKGAEVLLRSYEYGRIYVCATTVGMAESALDQAALYAQQRCIGGISILSFQQIQELLTDMQVKVDAMKALLYKTAWDLDRHAEDVRLSTSLLKRFVPKTAMEVADSAMQIFGNLGYISSSRVARIWEECRGNRIAEGTDQVMTVIAAKRIARRAQREKRDAPTWRF